MRNITVLFTVVVVCWFALHSCVPTPVANPDDVVVLQPGGTYVLCEGLWQQDNAVLSYLAPSLTVVRDVMTGVNPGEKIGDTASDMLHIGGNLVIVVSTSKTLLVLDAITGELKHRIALPNKQPFRITTDGVDRLWVTNLGDDSITEISLLTMTIAVARVPVGPAPEGICVLRNELFIGLSGMGDLRKDEPGAGSIVVLRRYDLAAVDTIASLPNVAAVMSDPERDRVWASYRNFASTPDSLGGVVVINGTTHAVEDRWRFASPTDVVRDPSTGAVYVLHQYGIDRISGPNELPERIISHTSGSGQDVWYALAFDDRTGHLFVGNARSYVTDGELIEISVLGAIVRRTQVGLNPCAVVH